MCALPAVADPSFWQKTLPMAPLPDWSRSGSQWAMGQPGTGYVVYCAGDTLQLPLDSDRGAYRLRWVDPDTGALTGRTQRIRGGGPQTVPTPKAGIVAWLDR